MSLAQSSLVRLPRNVPPTGSSPGGSSRGSWGPKQCRAYQRLLSGLQHHQAQRSRIRILTLTSVPGTSWRRLNSWFQALRKRIERKYAKMHYWKLRSFEGPGAGVLHVLYAGPWIPQSWLSRAWRSITGARIVYIQELKSRSGSKRIARYMISNYMMHHEIFRQSWSWSWLFRGFVGYWNRVKGKTSCLGDAIAVWSRIVRRQDPEKWLRIWLGSYYCQTRLKKRGRLDPSVVVL